ncbi:uncharacterized protein LOC128723859 [Anopheles nili]|uniref:uncharacterized protein LOC128723859 n=1 Tax=Anopheles nili TaxID=185578 RepID=UPI00237AC009|nr:uncharacterized protein LOC128723859 [Anopheles nili]
MLRLVIYMETLTTLTLQNSVRGPKFYCYLCDYYLHTRLSMITHMKMHLKPFCVVCFETFTTCMDMNAHALESHPYVFPTAAISRIEVGDFFDFSQTEAPPNSPNHSFETQLDLNADFVNNNSIPTLLTEKLLEHQMEVEQRDSNIVNSDDILNHQPEEIQKTPSPPQANKAPTTRNSRTKEKRTPPVVSTGKVLKNSKPKGSASKIVSTMRTERVDRDDSVLRRITSRFGRSISLKVPQF